MIELFYRKSGVGCWYDCVYKDFYGALGRGIGLFYRGREGWLKHVEISVKPVVD